MVGILTMRTLGPAKPTGSWKNIREVVYNPTSKPAKQEGQENSESHVFIIADMEVVD